MELHKAQPIAKRIKEELSRYCHKVEIAGGIRRQKPDVHDIEIVALPSVERSEGLFLDDFTKTVGTLGNIVKGKPQGKMCQVELPEGIMLDLFIANEYNWGYIYALRTGSDKFNQHTILPNMKNSGYTLQGGYVWLHGIKLKVDTEQFLFDLMETGWVPPEQRR